MTSVALSLRRRPSSALAQDRPWEGGAKNAAARRRGRRQLVVALKGPDVEEARTIYRVNDREKTDIWLRVIKRIDRLAIRQRRSASPNGDKFDQRAYGNKPGPRCGSMAARILKPIAPTMASGRVNRVRARNSCAKACNCFRALRTPLADSRPGCRTGSACRTKVYRSGGASLPNCGNRLQNIDGDARGRCTWPRQFSARSPEASRGNPDGSKHRQQRTRARSRPPKESRSAQP